MNRPHRPLALLLAAAALAAAAVAPAGGQPRPAAPGSRQDAVNLYAARSLLKKARNLLTLGEKERGVKMLETIVQQYADTPVRYEAWLELGRFFLQQRNQPKAITVLRHLLELKKPDEPLAGEMREMYLEALYLTGMAYFQTRQYGAAFPVLRRITTDYPNTVWANQAYYYVGMCHFAQGNWNKAIKALSLVGTFVDPNSPTVRYVEAGRRFYVKIEDADLPILHALGREIRIELTTDSGDRETATCTPLSLRAGAFLASLPTEVGPARPGDGTLQVVGGDAITTRYVDVNTHEGSKDVARTTKVAVVSTASLTFTMGTYESQAPAAFVGQPLHIVCRDVDRDTSDAPDKVAVKVVSRYRVSEDEAAPAAPALTAELTFEDRPQYKVRDEVTVELTELGDAPVHTGRFANSLAIAEFRPDEPVDRNDRTLTCAVGDEVVATYVDELHIGGRTARQVVASTRVSGEITSRLGTSVNFVPDPILRAKKNLVEGTAFLELARIFASMGLRKGARTKALEGLERADDVIRTESPIPSELKEQAFKLRWNLYITIEDFRNAMATCQMFNRLYPDSPFVDQAMMGIGEIRMKNRQWKEARAVYQQVLRLPNSLAKDQAQFRIAECIEKEALERAAAAAARNGETVKPNAGLTEAAIRAYKACAEKYPESQYAGQSLGKLVEYYLESRDYARADDLLEQIFQDYPDANFLDQMLLRWIYVAYRMGNYRKAYEKGQQLLFEYPASPHAAKAKQLLPTIKGELDKPAPAGSEEKNQP